ncbi:MAG TPA: hypothetical protein V6C97_04405 [Oculatellaceae cyanobacterium]
MKFVVCVVKVPSKHASSASSANKTAGHMLLEQVFVNGGNRLSQAPAKYQDFIAFNYSKNNHRTN